MRRRIVTTARVTTSRDALLHDRTANPVPLPVARSSVRKHGRDPLSQVREQALFEPGVLRQPDVVSRTGVWKRNSLRPERAPVPHCLRHRLFGIREVISLCVLANHDGQLQIVKFAQDLFSPGWSALAPRREVARPPCSWIAEAHWQESNLAGVVEDFIFDAHPFSKPLPARIIPGNPALVHPSPGCLPHDQDPCATSHLYDRSRPKWQIVGTDLTRPDCGQEFIEIVHSPIIPLDDARTRATNSSSSPHTAGSVLGSSCPLVGPLNRSIWMPSGPGEPSPCVRRHRPHKRQVPAA